MEGKENPSKRKHKKAKEKDEAGVLGVQALPWSLGAACLSELHPIDRWI